MISFIVPAYNEERYLGATLEAMRAAASAVGEPYEIVVADDASNDATADVAVRGGARVVSVEHRQIAATRNSGAAAARGDLFIFVDADTRIDEAVVRAALAAVKDGAVGGGAGVRFDAAPWWGRLLVRRVVFWFRVFKLAAGCFVFATRAAFEATGGFNEDYFAAEEIVMSRALKRQGRFVVLREAVITSARKFEGMSAWRLLWLILRLGAHGHGGVKKRSTTSFWYPEKR